MKEFVGKTYYYPEFITEEEQKIIKEWALRNESFLIPNPSGPFRARELFELIPEKLELLDEIKKRIVEIEDIEGKYSKAMRGDFVSIQRNGAQVQEHIDHHPTDPSIYMRRYNIFISLPEKGGLPIYGGEIIEITERALLRVDAGLISHSTTTVEGEIPRIMISYGVSIKK